MEYGQFCPIAKATELIGEKWTVLIIREALMGSTLPLSQAKRLPSLLSEIGGLKRKIVLDCSA